MLKEIQASKLSDIEFNAMVIRKLNELNENYKNYREATRNLCKLHQHEKGHTNYQQEPGQNKECISELNNTVEGRKTRRDEAED